MPAQLTLKERQMIRALGMETVLTAKYAPMRALETCMARAFLGDLQGPAVESLRRCLKAVYEGTHWRHTPEYDALIQLDEDFNEKDIQNS